MGRVRQSVDDSRTIELFACGDNLRKGAALNTAQIKSGCALCGTLTREPDTVGLTTR